MKKIIKGLIAGFNKLLLKYFSVLDSTTSGNRFYLLRFIADKDNNFAFNNSAFEKTILHVKGKKNSLVITDALVSKTEITIQGKNNQLILEHGVKLCSAKINIRGNDCSIFIGKNTSFGGIRIVNVGQNCTIKIGEECMFADQIELWASDTHPIYNGHGEIINNEQPINIGNNVWVGSHTIILKGVNIGNGSVIGMGTVVTRDIPDHCISVGHPNKVIKNDISWSMYYPETQEEAL